VACCLSRYAILKASIIPYFLTEKVADVVGFVNHTSKITEKLARQTYEGFLTEPEMQQMLSGTEFFFDADQLRTRLESRMKYLEDKFNKEQLAKQEPKKTVSKKKASAK